MHIPSQPWSQLTVRVSCEGPEGIALAGVWLPGLTWTTSSPHLLYVWVGQVSNWSVWSADCVETGLRHRSALWFILSRDAGQALPPSSKGS